MKYFMEHDKHLHHACRVLFLAAVMVSMAVCVATSTASADSQETPQHMFMQIAEDVKVDAAAKTIRFMNVNQ